MSKPSASAVKHNFDLSGLYAALRESEERYNVLIETFPDLVIVIDINGRIRQISPSAKDILGLEDQKEALGKKILDFVAPENRHILLSDVRARMGASRSVPSQYHLRVKDGQAIDVEVMAGLIHGEDGKLEGFTVIVRDCTERIKEEKIRQELRDLADSYRDTANALNSALSLNEILDTIFQHVGRLIPSDSVDILVESDDGGFAQCKSRSAEMGSSGLSEKTAILPLYLEEAPTLKRIADFGIPLVIDEIKNTEEWLKHPYSRGIKSFLGAPILVERKTMGFLVFLSSQAGFFKRQHADRIMIFTNQIAVAVQRVRLIARLDKLATTDPLTGVSNRRSFFERAELVHAATIRYRHPLSAIMMDIDHFKQVNDSYGHSVGDEVLREFAKVCANSLRIIDIFARYGGEEFIALLPETEAAFALLLAERLREKTSQMSFSVPDRAFAISASFGIAEFKPGESLETLLDHADKALYEAKESGRNRVMRWLEETSY